MADKEVTVFVIDISQRMSQSRSDFSGTVLEWCLQYVWDKIGLKIMSGRKTDYVAVVAVGADQTDHPLGDEEAYEHIRVILPLPNRKKEDLKLYTYAATRPCYLQRLTFKFYQIYGGCDHVRITPKFYE